MERFRLKTLLGWALGWFVVRYLFFMVAGITGQRAWMWPGVALQGVCFTLYFITAQVFLDRRVEAGLRGQAQGLLSLASGGLGSLAGTLFTGWLHRVTVTEGGGGWPVFWGVLAGMIACCAVYFLTGYRGRGAAGRAGPPGCGRTGTETSGEDPGQAVTSGVAMISSR